MRIPRECTLCPTPEEVNITKFKFFYILVDLGYEWIKRSERTAWLPRPFSKNAITTSFYVSFFVLKLISDCFSFGLPRSAIGPKKWRQLFNQIAAEVEPITNRLIAYSRASGSLLDFALSSHWLLMIIFLRCDWLLRLLWFGISYTQLKSSLSLSSSKHFYSSIAW